MMVVCPSALWSLGWRMLIGNWSTDVGRKNPIPGHRFGKSDIVFLNSIKHVALDLPHTPRTTHSRTHRIPRRSSLLRRSHLNPIQRILRRPTWHPTLRHHLLWNLYSHPLRQPLTGQPIYQTSRRYNPAPSRSPERPRFQIPVGRRAKTSPQKMTIMRDGLTPCLHPRSGVYPVIEKFDIPGVISWPKIAPTRHPGGYQISQRAKFRCRRRGAASIKLSSPVQLRMDMRRILQIQLRGLGLDLIYPVNAQKSTVGTRRWWIPQWHGPCAFHSSLGEWPEY